MTTLEIILGATSVASISFILYQAYWLHRQREELTAMHCGLAALGNIIGAAIAKNISMADIETVKGDEDDE